MKSKHDNILKIANQKLKYFKYAERTIETYLHYIEKFLLSVDKYPQHLTSNDFQEYLNKYSFSSTSHQNQIISAIKFLYEKALNKKYNKIDFERPRKEKRLPKIIDSDYLLNKIDAILNIKHKAILMLAYSVGLRVSEVLNIKITDVDSTRMIIHVNNAKGNKDRIVPLSNNVLNTLREYFKVVRPEIYLFNGQRSLKYTASSCNKLVKQYIGEQYHFHLLRHTCFTNLLENGTDLRIIQKIAGHSCSRTTEIYTHVSNKLLNKVILPI